MLTPFLVAIPSLTSMTLDAKLRYGMMALGGASLVLASIGIHVSPLDAKAMSGAGS